MRGRDAASYLQAMVSNDVEALALGEACDALLLTPKARVIAPLTVLRRGVDDFLLLTEPGLGERVRTVLLRSRFAAKCEIEGRGARVRDRLRGGSGNPERRLRRSRPSKCSTAITSPASAPTSSSFSGYEPVRPLWAREIDDRILPAEAGLDQRAVDFEKGCYPGQEPIARQHYRGRVNRTLRVLAIEGDVLPRYDAELTFEGKVVGRMTSAALDGDEVVGLAYVRVEVPQDATLRLEERRVTQLDLPPPRP